ncbi:MAG: serine kinase, partial [Anaerolineales bacterium]
MAAKKPELTEAAPAPSPYAYQAYGLIIYSALELPELSPVAGRPEAADLSITLGPVRPPEGQASPRFAVGAAGEIYQSFPDAGSFLMRAGREIVVDPAEGVGGDVLRLYLLGPVLALALHQRGWLMLHASVVAMGEQAVAFLGGSGWGKSTMAGMLHQRGHALVADDFVAVPAATEGGQPPRVYPGFPQLKLWPEAAALLGAEASELHRLHPDFDKQARRLRQGFAPAALPLGRLYVLAEGDSIAIERLEKQAALVELVRHSYAAMALPKLDAAEHLRQCAAL